MIYRLSFSQTCGTIPSMPLYESAVYMNTAILKLMRVIGTPEWYQGVSAIYGAEPAVVLVANRMILPSLIKSTIPMEVDGIPVKIVYKNPVCKFYGKDGPST